MMLHDVTCATPLRCCNAKDEHWRGGMWSRDAIIVELLSTGYAHTLQ